LATEFKNGGNPREGRGQSPNDCISLVSLQTMAAKLEWRSKNWIWGLREQHHQACSLQLLLMKGAEEDTGRPSKT